MNQIWISKAGAPEVLELREAPDPSPGAGEALIEVAAAGVNFADLLARMGMYPDAPPLPTVVGYEIAGTVREVGPGVVEVSPGDRVLGLTRFGGYSSVVATPIKQLFPVPDDLGMAEAAAMPVTYMTAALALHRFANIQPGERVLIHNAGGGVGIAAVQLARHRGAVIFGTASEWKHHSLRELGVDHAIDYRSRDFVEEIRELTDDAGVHAIIDPIGGSNVARDLSILAPMGRLVVFGLSSSVRNGRRSRLSLVTTAFRMPRVGLLSLLGNNHSVAGLNIGHLWGELDRLRPVMGSILDLLRDGSIAPVIDSRYPFAEAAAAHLRLQERKNFGKVILEP